jgi:hypothetical protein
MALMIVFASAVMRFANVIRLLDGDDAGELVYGTVSLVATVVATVNCDGLVLIVAPYSDTINRVLKIMIPEIMPFDIKF